ADAGKTGPPSRLILSQTSAGKSCRTTSLRIPNLAPDDQAGWTVAIDLASKPRPRARTLHAMRASLLDSAIAITLLCSCLLAASVQGVSPYRSQLFGMIKTTQAACTNSTRR